jgi:hypothetical protein
MITNIRVHLLTRKKKKKKQRKRLQMIREGLDHSIDLQILRLQ